MIRVRAIWGLLWLSMLGLAAGYGGALLPAADSLGTFRPLLALLAVVCAFWLRRDPRAACLGLVASIVVLMQWLGHRPVAASALPDTGPIVTLYQQNLLFDRREFDALEAEIRRRLPDVITFEEVSTQNLPLLERLADLYPHQHYCGFVKNGGLAVLVRDAEILARYPCQGELGLAAMQILPAGHSQPVWVGALYLVWPWPYGQARQLEQLEEALAGLRGPVVLGGDFNAVGWSHAVSRVETAARARRAGRLTTSYRLGWFGYPLGIDHVLVSGGAGQVETLPRLGSDHNGLFATVLPTPAAP